MPNNNTIAIAIAALLVGGVATAGYMNSRASKPVAPVPATAVAPALPQSQEPGPAGNAIPAPGRLEYADVIDVKPVSSSEPLYATVIGSEPIRETSTSNTPQQVCRDVVVQERLPERDGNVGGTVAGALIGGLVGNQVGKGDGRKLATVAGAVGGGYVGHEIDKRHQGGRVVDRTERQCRTVNNASTSERTVGWNVTYRNPDGSTGSMRTDNKPGSRIALGNADRTTGYDVTYRYNGQQRTVRMAQMPGTQLPVLDGQVVTQTASVDGGAMR
ncbi:glycine zipper 2TM domain-containing protein [Thermomonas sp.]|uniref:glycine zipper 2TM domain-containing protein n=1 Tax=Thermomonas sp. TaxID=1971895 RepID=UPI0035B10520